MYAVFISTKDVSSSVNLMFHCVHLQYAQACQPPDARGWARVAWVLAMSLLKGHSGDLGVENIKVNFCMQCMPLLRVICLQLHTALPQFITVVMYGTCEI